ncbi:hypothetical protein GN958_ATG16157 [Phytophthora infestans]|uniref:Uncharacterized protein n=1 Tax=Phytophthora infestans TaxID=4787 RepID=A0A8S9U4R6_PHYIN|nr:hypothetical protein GN958_ATG16157 [Phytophthora infestans]
MLVTLAHLILAQIRFPQTEFLVEGLFLNFSSKIFKGLRARKSRAMSSFSNRPYTTKKAIGLAWDDSTPPSGLTKVGREGLAIRCETLGRSTGRDEQGTGAWRPSATSVTCPDTQLVGVSVWPS